MKPTLKSVTWSAGHAFAYLNPFDVNAVGVELIDMLDCINVNQNKAMLNEEIKPPCGARDAGRRDPRRTEPDLPDHCDRQTELRHLGVKIDADGLTPGQYVKLSAILYRARFREMW